MKQQKDNKLIKERIIKIKKIIGEKINKPLPSKDEIQEEILQNRNHSWIREVIRDEKMAESIFQDLDKGISKEVFCEKYTSLNNIIIKYLVSNEITKAEFLYESYILAKALRANGISKGDEIIICMDRTPEYTYLIGAASIIGAKINMICEKFSSDFIINKILKNKSWNTKLSSNDIKEAIERGITSPEGEEYDDFIEEKNLPKEKQPKKILFYQDIKSKKLSNIILSIPEIQSISVPFKRSAKNLEKYNKYTKQYYEIEYDENYKIDGTTEYEEFINSGKKYDKKVENKSELEDDFTITYSSGTTGEPKGIVHSNKHYITMARYHDHEVSGIPSVGVLSTYSNIPSYSNSYVSSVISDNMIQNGVIMLDPVDKMEYFKIGLNINEGNMNIGSSSAWELLALQYFNNPNDFQNYKLPHAVFNFAVGEEFLPGTEKICNKFLRSIKAGTNFSLNKLNVKSPIPLAVMSTAGGSCETGSIFLRLFRSLYSSISKRENRKDPIGMSVYNFVEVKIIREDGTFAEPYEYGRMVLNSDCTMKRYNNNPEATEQFFINDATGRKWVDMKVYAYIDENGNVTIKDRYKPLTDGLAEYNIADAICRDTKNICSVRVVEVEPKKYVAHIIFQPNKHNKEDIIKSAIKRVKNECKKDLDIYFVEKTCDNYYPLTKSLKKDDNAMILEGYNNIINLDEKGYTKVLHK